MKINLLVFALIITTTMACKKKEQKPQDLSHEAREEMWAADVAMSELAVKEGFYKALLTFADENCIKPEEGKLPILSKKELEAIWSGKEDPKNISWIPLKADASRSGELGYTFGNWKLVAKDTTYHGNYYTFWKRQEDKSWKWIFDGGNDTPEPPK